MRRMHRGRSGSTGLALLLLAALGWPAVTQAARATPAQTTPKSLVARYFADLNAHRYRSAYRLEATCAATLAIKNPRSGIPGYEGLPARGAWPAAAKTFVQSVRVESIRQLPSSTSGATHPVRVEVTGIFRFSYSAGSPESGRRTNGQHTFVVIVRQCSGHWQVDPNWLSSGGTG